jgi:hypothetical protein
VYVGFGSGGFFFTPKSFFVVNGGRKKIIYIYMMEYIVCKICFKWVVFFIII